MIPIARFEAILIFGKTFDWCNFTITIKVVTHYRDMDNAVALRINPKKAQIRGRGRIAQLIENLLLTQRPRV